MKDASGQSTRAPGTPGSRQRQQQERQARVGILRNPNSPPVPPPRRARLMGKWPHLRSSRRPRAADPATAAAPQADAPGALAGGAQVDASAVPDGNAAIDMAALAAILDQPEPEPPRREPYAARFRGLGAATGSSGPLPPGAADDVPDCGPGDNGSGGFAAPVDDGVADTPADGSPAPHRGLSRWRWWAGVLAVLGLAGAVAAVSGLG